MHCYRKRRQHWAQQNKLPATQCELWLLPVKIGFSKSINVSHCTKEHFTQYYVAVQAALTLHLPSYPPPIGQQPLSFLAFQRNQIKSQVNPIDTNILYRLCRPRTEIMGNKSEEPIQIPGKTNWHNHLLTSLKCDTNITSIRLFVWPGQLLDSRNQF